MIILGAGLAGSLAGVLSGDCTIYEAAPAMPRNHEGLLRFRSDAIGKLLGLQFEKVRVTKGIWIDGGEAQASPRLSNLYSRKVVGVPIPRSIGSLDPVDRYICPVDLPAYLGQILGRKAVFFKRVEGLNEDGIAFGDGSGWSREGQPIISTLPLPVLMKCLGMPIPDGCEFACAPVYITKIKIPGANVHQTIYYPGDETAVYRASMVGDMLIVEATDFVSFAELDVVCKSFGLCSPDEVLLLNREQSGKFTSLPDSIRHKLLYDITLKYNIWSLGRYACWRNIVLDDVLDDYYKIRRMMGQSEYELRKEIC